MGVASFFMKQISENILPVHRCPYCNKFLYRGDIIEIEIKCPRCKHIIHWEYLDLKQAVNDYRKRHSLRAQK
jgi:phage FluMu protein Com